MIKVLSLALAAFLLLAPVSTYAGEPGASDGTELDGFELGNGGLIENLVGHFSLNLREGLFYRNKGAAMEIRSRSSLTAFELKISRDESIQSFDDLVERTKGRGWKAIQDRLLGTYDGIERFIRGRYGIDSRNIRVFLRPKEVVGVELKGCTNCREEFERLRDSLDSLNTTSVGEY